MKNVMYIIAAYLLVLLSCSAGDRIAGSGGGSETTNGVTACVLYGDGTPAAGSAVRLRPADYVSQPAESIADSMNGITDSLGRFLFTDIKPGEYYIEVQKYSESITKTGSVLFTGSIARQDTTDLGTHSIRPHATLIGTVDTTGIGGAQLYAMVRGLERIVEVDTSGEFVFDDLPEGYLDVVIVSEDVAYVSKEIVRLKTESSDTVALDIGGSSTYTGFVYLDTEAAAVSPNTTLTGFPLLVRLDSSIFDFGTADSRGRDIRFFSMDNLPLAHEIEQWDPVSREAAVWVRVDEISGGNSELSLIMKWGDPAAYDQSNGAMVFDTANGFAGVWHLNENPSAGAGALRDRTFNGYNGTPSGSMTNENVAEGVSGEALYFNGLTDTVEAGMLNLSGNYTLSCWVKPSRGPNSNWRFIIKEASYTLWFDTEWDGIRAEHFTDAFIWRGIYQDTPDSIPHSMALETWSHVAGTFDGEKIRLYVNGEVVDSSQSFALNPHVEQDNPVIFGGRDLECFKGVMDEIRIESVARTPQWIKLVYLTQQPESGITRLQLR